MSIPLLQKARIGAYIVRQQLAGRRRYPLVLMLEPLFRCNLACAGCGKIDYPHEILHQRLSVEQCLAAVYERAVAAIRAAKTRGFRVNINCTLFNDSDPERVARFFDQAVALGIDGITVSPGYAYERAPDQAHFLTRERTKQLFRDIFRRGRGARAWSFSQSSLFLDFLAGNQEYRCTPWGNPTRNVFGWQRPCYLL